MIRWDLFTIKHAVSICLNRTLETETNWNTEVLVDTANNLVLEWNVTGVTQPTQLELETAWQLARLNYYKGLQLTKLSLQTSIILEKGSEGCITSVLDTEGDPIVVDARRGYGHNDVQNFERAISYMARKGLTEIVLKDFNNNYHTLSAADMQIIVNDLEDYGMAMLQTKWTKEAFIMTSTVLDDILACDMSSHYVLT